MSVDGSLKSILDYYDQVTMPQINEELKYYSPEEVRQIRRYMFHSMWHPSTFDDRDIVHWKNFFWKCLTISVLSSGTYKLCSDENLQKNIKWRPSWNQTQVVKFVKYKRGIPFIFVTTALLMPDLSLNFLRAGLKRYHIANYVQDQGKIEKLKKMHEEETNNIILSQEELQIENSILNLKGKPQNNIPKQNS